MTDVFVITLGDVVGLAFLGLLIVVGGALWLVEFMDRRRGSYLCPRIWCGRRFKTLLDYNLHLSTHD